MAESSNLPAAQPATDARQVPDAAPQLQPRISPHVALALLRGKADTIAVPQTWRSAHAVFWQHPTPIFAALSIAALTATWMQAPMGLLGASAILVGAALWIAQEWLIHAKLFHGGIEWFGKQMHADHHAAPYYHISLDGPELALPVIAAATALLWGFLGRNVGACAAVGYIGQGLFYQFTHYAVHTRAVPRSRFWRRVRQHHMQHHCRNENYWLAFTLPAMDSWLGTSPAAGSVPMTPLARSSVQRKQLQQRI